MGLTEWADMVGPKFAYRERDKDKERQIEIDPCGGHLHAHEGLWSSTMTFGLNYADCALARLCRIG